EKTSEKIRRIIGTNNQVTIAELSEQIGVSTRTIERNIKNLQETGALRRQGPDKGGHWELIDV
ncbi:MULTISPECIES: HTH domain-containing protein, partial [unclassified Lentimonas]